MEEALDLVIIPSKSEIRIKLCLEGLCYLLVLLLIVQSIALQSAEHLAFPYLGLKWKQD